MSAGPMHPGQHPVDEDLVRRLIAGQFPRWAGLPVTRFPSGGTVNALFRLGADLVVRLPLVAGGAGDVLLEREWLPRVAPRLPVAIPEVLGAGEPGAGYPWPWSVYRWLPGEIPQVAASRDPLRLATDLAGFVAAMRDVTLPGAPRAHRGGPLAALDTPSRAAIEQLRRIPDEGIDCDSVARSWADALRLPDGPGRCGCTPISCRATSWSTTTAGSPR